MEDQTLVDDEASGGLGDLRLWHPPGTFSITPASRISIRAVGECSMRLSGIGLDWGSGIGGLAVAAAKIPAVTRVLGLEISEANIHAARENAKRNGVQDKVSFLRSDSFEPETAEGRNALDALHARVTFLIANPPSSEGDDGFSFRRRILDEARCYLSEGALVLLSISSQYGAQRIDALSGRDTGYSHLGIPASTDWVPFDLQRPDLLHCVELYAEEEARGGPEYGFLASQSRTPMNARAALNLYRETGESPHTKWQTTCSSIDQA